MKKIFIVSCLLIFGSVAAQEISKNALGVRLGSNNGFGSSINYQRALDGNNRLEFDLGWRSTDKTDAFKLVGLYQWVKPIDAGLQWYYGLGGGVGSWSRDRYENRDTSGSFLALAGNIGIEYNFDIPLLISLDLRPEFYVGSYHRSSSFGPDIALSLRYQF